MTKENYRILKKKVGEHAQAQVNWEAKNGQMDDDRAYAAHVGLVMRLKLSNLISNEKALQEYGY